MNPGWTPALAIKPEPGPPPCTAVTEVEPNNSMSAPQVISGSCNQISATFLNDTGQEDYFRISVPAGATVTALMNNLTVDYDMDLYDANGNWVGYSYNPGSTPEQASYTNTTTAAMNIYVAIWRSSSTKTTYQLRVSY